MSPPGIEPAITCFPACPSNHSALGRYIDMIYFEIHYHFDVRTFTVLFDQTILQELCIVCKGYIENKNELTLFTYSFVIDTI